MPTNITDSWLKRKDKASKRYAERGRRGFCVRVYESGVQAFEYRYKLNGTQKIINIGYYPDTDLADAHLKYEELRSLVRKGIDPKAPIPTAGTDEETSFGDVAEAWYKSHCLAQVMDAAGRWKKHPNKTPLKAPQYKRLQLDNHLLPTWKDEPISSISRVDANRRIDEIVAEGHPVMANRVGATISQIWGWALDEGIIQATPMQGLSKRGGREVSRERILTNDELKILWEKLDTAELSPVTVAALRFCLLTGARRSEVAGAKWSEIKKDDDQTLWTIPASRTKTNKPHVIPLSDMVVEILEDLKAWLAQQDEGQYSQVSKSAVFPSPTGGTLRPHALSRAVHRKQKHIGIPKWTVHDLRRTVRSKLAELGVSSVVAKKCLNHSLEGMDAVYDRYDYQDEKAEALQKWADLLRLVISGSGQNVIPIEAAGHG